MQDLSPLLTELRTNNAIQKELLKEKKIDDTPKQLLMGNMFEIFAQYDIFKKRQEQGQTIGREIGDENDNDSLSNNITETLLGKQKDGGLNHIATVLEALFLISGKSFNLTVLHQKNMLSRMTTNKEALDYFAEGFMDFQKNLFEQTKNITASNANAFKSAININKSIISTAEDIAETLDKILPEEEGSIPINAPYKDVPMGEGNVPPESAEKEKEKDNKTFLQKTIGVIANPISSLGTGIKKLGETFTIGNAALVTVLTLIVSGLIAFFPAFTGFAKGLIDMVGAIFAGDGEAFGKAVGDNLGGLFLLGLFLARKAIAGKFMKSIFTPLILLAEPFPLPSSSKVFSSFVATKLSFSFLDIFLYLFFNLFRC